MLRIQSANDVILGCRQIRAAQISNAGPSGESLDRGQQCSFHTSAHYSAAEQERVDGPGFTPLRFDNRDTCQTIVTESVADARADHTRTNRLPMGEVRNRV